MTTTAAPAQNIGQSGWHHAVKTFGDMGEQTAGANGAIKMTGGKRQRQSKRQSKKQSQKGGKRQSRRHRQSKKQRGGRR